VLFGSSFDGFFLRVSGHVAILNSYRHGPSDILSPDRIWNFSHGLHDVDGPSNTYPDIYVLQSYGLYLAPE
jgi:hypothetical protein